MRPLRFWTDEPVINGHRPAQPQARPPWWLRGIGLVFVAAAIWLVLVLASIISEG